MKEYKAKTIEEAIEIGLKDMNLSKEEADIKIINDKGLFKKATVQIQKKADIIVNNEKQEHCLSRVCTFDTCGNTGWTYFFWLQSNFTQTVHYI